MLRLATALVLVVLALSPASGQTPKRGGILHAMQAEDLPAGFSIHETATIMGLWPVMPCYSNLVLFDPLKPRETPETIIPELAEKWSWQDGYRNLVFFLRKGNAYFARWPYVKNLVPHAPVYNFARMQEVWLDR